MAEISNLMGMMSGSKLSPQQLIRGSEAVLVVLLAITLANLVWALLPGPSSSNLAVVLADQPDYAAAPVAGSIGTGQQGVSPPLRDMFGRAVESEAGTQFVEEEIRETQLNLTLKGVLAHDNSTRKLALIARGNQKEEVYRVGDTIEGAEILDIRSRRVLIRRNGITESINLDVNIAQTRNSGDVAPPAINRGTVQGSSGFRSERSGIRRISDNERVVPQATLRQQLQNLPQLLTQAKAVPHTENGQQTGFRVVEIQDGSVFHDLGLEREDVIRAVNGTPLRTIDDALKAYSNLKSARSFQLDLLRRGRPLTIDFSVQ